MAAATLSAASLVAGTADAGGALERVTAALFPQVDAALARARATPGDLGVYVRLGASARTLGPGRGERLGSALLELAAARYSAAPGVSSLDVAAGAGVPNPDDVEARGVDVAVYLEAEVAEGFLVLTGDVLVTDRSIWDAPTSSAAAPSESVPAAGGTTVLPVAAKLFVRERLDAELRHYLGAMPSRLKSGKLRLDTWPYDGSDVLALGFGDLDTDGHDELVVLERERVRLLRWSLPGEDASMPDGGPAHPFRVVGEWSFEGLTRAREPSRDPVGSVALSPPEAAGRPPTLWVRTSDLDRARALRFESGKLGPVGEWAGWPLALTREASGDLVWVGGELGPGTAAFGPGLPRETVHPDGTRARLEPLDAGAAFVARVSRAVPGADGTRPVVAMIDDRGRLTVTDRGKTARGPSAVGFAVDLGDLDDDGRVDVAAASAASPGGPDEMVLFVAGGAAIVERWRSGPLDGEIRAVAIGDVDHDGRLDVVGAVQRIDGTTALAVVGRD